MMNNCSGAKTYDAMADDRVEVSYDTDNLMNGAKEQER